VEELELVEEEISDKQNEIDELQHSIKAKLTSKEDANRRHIKLITRLTQLNQQQTRIVSLLEEFERRKIRLVKEKTEVEVSLHSVEPQIADLKSRLTTHKEESEEIEDHIQSIEAEIQLEQRNVSDLHEELNQTSQNLFRTEARLQSLNEMEMSMEGYSSGIKDLFQALEQDQNGKGDLCLLMDAIQTEEQYQHLVALALHHHLDTVVVSGVSSARAWSEHVLNNEKGRVTFLPLDVVPREPPALEYQISEGSGRSLLSVVTCDPTVEKAVTWILGSYILVDSLDQAVSMYTKNPNTVSYITPDGTIITRDGFFMAGRDTNGSLDLFSRKQEIQALEQNTLDIKSCCTQLEEKIKARDEVIAGKNEILQQKEDEDQELQMAIQGIEKDVLGLKKEQSRLQDTREVIDLELEQVQLDVQTNNHDLEELKKSIRRCEQDISAQEADIATWEERIASLNEQKEYFQDELTEKQIKQASFRERVESREKSIHSHWERLQEFIYQIKRNKKRQIEASQQKLSLEQNIVDTEAQLQEYHTRLDGLRRNLDTLTSRHDTLSESLRQDDDLERSLHKKLVPLRDELKDLQIEGRGLEIQLKHLEEDLETRLKTPLPDLAEVTDIPGNDEDAQKLHKKISQITKRLEKFDNVNLAAPDEYEALTAKLEEMNAQRQDIIEAMDTLNQSVKKIDRESIQRFVTCFHQVNDNFGRVFKRLFGGGFAELKLETEDDLLETGIIINAQPPGKKLQSLSLLSGGEKTLTAIALLVAVFFYRPSPFCFMDEVDAALDEVNTDRFCNLLREIAENAQIIMVTHSRKSIEAADVFYGVTMSDPGISKLISLQLDHASA